MNDSFSSEVGRILDRLLDEERTGRDEHDSRKARWLARIHRFRDLASDVVTPALQEAADSLRRRGWRAFVTDNTRFGMTVALEVDREGSHSRTLSLRLNAETEEVEALSLSPRGTDITSVVPLGEVDRTFVERSVIAFLGLLA
jgi:hypothetical protein